MIFKTGNNFISVFIKLFCAFLIIIIPVYAMSLFINKAGEENVRREISKALQAQTHYYLGSLESEIGKIISIQREYMFDEDLMKLSAVEDFMTSYERIKAVSNIEKRLSLLKNFSDYIASVDVYMPQNGRGFSSEQSVFYMTDKQKDFLKNGGNFNMPFSYYEGKLYLNMKYPESSSIKDLNRISHVISVQMSLQQIRKRLTEFSIYEKDGTILLDKSGGWYLSSSENDTVANELKNIYETQIQDKTSNGVEYVNAGGRQYMEVYEPSDALNAVLIAYLPVEVVLGQLEEYRTRFLVLSGIVLLIVILFSIWMYSMVERPIVRLITAFKRIEAGDFKALIEHKRHDDFGYLYDKFNRMVQIQKQSVEQIYEEKIRAQRAELRQLQYQISPHFLYNSLFMVHLMAQTGECKNIAVLSNYLTRYYQYITKANVNQVTLEEEAIHARDYIAIQTMRFQDRIHVEFDEIPEELGKLMVPRLILQPVIENAYGHGLKEVRAGGRLEIRNSYESHCFCISVEDNGKYIKDENITKLQEFLESDDNIDSIEKNTGLFNVHRRLKVKFGGESGIKVGKSGLGGLKVILKIDLQGEGVND